MRIAYLRMVILPQLLQRFQPLRAIKGALNPQPLEAFGQGALLGRSQGRMKQHCVVLELLRSISGRVDSMPEKLEATSQQVAAECGFQISVVAALRAVDATEICNLRLFEVLRV